MRYLISILLASVISATPVAALTAYFQRDLGTENFMRYCQYSNGKVYTVESTDLCPMSVEAGMDYGSRSGSSFGMMGMKKGEYVDGMTKVCIYDVLGEDKAVRVQNFELCPISPRF